MIGQIPIKWCKLGENLVFPKGGVCLTTEEAAKALEEARSIILGEANTEDEQDNKINDWFKKYFPKDA